MSNQRKIKRSELYRIVWEQPVAKLAPGLGLSDVGLRKVCVRANIPLPARGHWAKVAGGRIPKAVPLPKAEHDWDLTFNVPPPTQPEHFRSE
jgi:hypothetical protein